jgi:hypothetical protein
MGLNEKTVGGGAASGFATDFTNWLSTGLNNGQFGGASAANGAMGANPMGGTMGISNILNDLLSGGAGNIGGAMSDMISRSNDRNVAGLRSRFGAGGGTAFGTPAAHAEAVMRAEEAPMLTQAIGGLQLQALMPILQMMMGVTGLGTPQAQTTMQPNAWMQGLSALGPLLGGAGTLMGAWKGK